MSFIDCDGIVSRRQSSVNLLETMLKRREFLRLSSAALAAGCFFPSSGEGETAFITRLRTSPAVVVATPESTAKHIEVLRSWEGNSCRALLVNRGNEAVRVKEVVLFEVAHGFPAETHLYGESFQMLSQTAGTL